MSALLPPHAITGKVRISYSSLEKLHTCERLFELDKLLVGEYAREESQHLSFGHAFGAGVQHYLQHQDRDAAQFQAWLAYWPELEDEKKSMPRCMIALDNAFHALDNLLMEWELVSFEGKPAVELSFALHIDADYYYVGFLDAVIRNRFTGEYAVFECKTTGLSLLDLSPLYRNSGQALGYSVLLDRIVGKQLASYTVFYFVAQLGRTLDSCKIQTMDFNKTLLDRLKWFLTLGLDVKHLHEMAELGIYPKRGGSCLQFMRPCRHFGTCNLHSADVLKEREPDLTEYQFVYHLDDLIQDHLARIGEESCNVL